MVAHPATKIELQSSEMLDDIYLRTPNDRTRFLAEIRRDELISRLSTYGVVLLRGFSPDITQFSRLVESVTPNTAIDPAREFFAKNVQLVDSGVNEIGLHCENGTTPLRPQVVWFYCERAAISGSQTTICDGQKVWESLTPESKMVFHSSPVRFSRNVKRDLWIKYVRHHFEHLRTVATIDQKMLDDVFGHIPGAIVSLNDDGSLFLSHAVYAADSTLFSDRIAFANSLFGPSYNYEAPQIRFDNGKTIPQWALQEARAKSDRLTKNIPWQAGDIVMIDNTRVMHGRRQITDLNRKLFTALGFIHGKEGAR